MGGGGRTIDLGALRTPGDLFIFQTFLGFVHVRFCMLWVSDWLRAVLAAILRLKQTVIKEAGYADLFSYAHNGTHKNERKLVKTGC